MIINTGQRTDIPAHFPEWFANRLKEGVVCVRNPYNPVQVSRYRLDPAVVDVIGFCTKNPAPFFPYMDLLESYGQFWYVTITPYGKDIEPGVPQWNQVAEDFQRLSEMVGKNAVGWRYDPILVDGKYTVEFHLKAFKEMAERLSGYTDTVVISFIDIFEKVKKNFPEARPVSAADKLLLGESMIDIAASYGMTVKPCGEGDFLKGYGAECRGCMTAADYEKAIGKRLNIPRADIRNPRIECSCFLGYDIGAYDTCLHYCRYCYANNDLNQVAKNKNAHDPGSPFLIGNYREGDIIHDVEQKSWIDGQISIFDYI